MIEQAEQLARRFPDRSLDPKNSPATELRREEVKRQPLPDTDVTAEMKTLGYSQISLPHVSILTLFQRMRDRIFGNRQDKKQAVSQLSKQRQEPSAV